jgi:hypothetical protein
MLDLPREHSVPVRYRAALVSAFLVIAAAFYIFTYNSGFGRALLHGFRLYTFVLSKGWATYAMTAGALALLPALNHAWISLVIALLFALAVAATWWLGYWLFSPAVAVLTALLVAVCGFFMEINFLEPEIPVYICGLLAVYALETGRRSPARCIWAGVCLGVGCAFKSVALFYMAATFGYLLLSLRQPPIAVRLRSALWIVLGFAGALALPACYFAATGQLQNHIQWSFVFPLLHYPSHTIYLRKLYTKLLWFFVLLLIAGLLASTYPLRRAIFDKKSRVVLILWMGAVSMLSLIKTQSSHYVFPGAAFLSFFIAETLYCWWKQNKRSSLLLWIPAGAAILVFVSAWLYSPSAMSRFFYKRDFSYEDSLTAGLQALTRPEDRVLFLHGGMALYWLADRYPVTSFISTDVQTTYLLFQQPEMLMTALDDPRLRLVEFDPQSVQFDDSRFLATDHHRKLMDRFFRRLQERFAPVLDPRLPLKLWAPKP